MHLRIKERVELVLMSGADGATNRSVAKKFNRIYLAKKFCFNKNVCYYYLNCFICFGALFMAQNVCYYYLNCFICFGALFMAHPVLMDLKRTNLDWGYGDSLPGECVISRGAILLAMLVSMVVKYSSNRMLIESESLATLFS